MGTSVCSKLAIGTAQFGLDYGVANVGGRPSDEDIRAILERAAEAACLTIDTAAAYGESEAVLGRLIRKEIPFRIVTKTRPLYGLPINDSALLAVRDAFQASLDKLKRPAVYGLLVHHATDLLASGGYRLYELLCELKERGLVKRIGVSVYDSAQIDALVDAYALDLVQLPLNVLDQRLLFDGTLDRLHGKGVEVHARSIFLQGLLLMPLDKVPGYFAPLMPLLSQWHHQTARQGMSLAEAALAFVGSLPQIHTMVVGFDTAAHFEQVLRAASADRPFDARGLACNAPEFVNPGKWKL